MGWFFPRTCFSCKKEGEWICNDCLKSIELAPSAGCPVCGTTTAHGEPCLPCKQISSLDGLTTLARYNEDNALGKLIWALKYARATDVATTLPKIFEPTLSTSALVRLEPLQRATIIPVPLHASRESDRGFNQAAYIGEALAVALARPYSANILIRSKKTKQQAVLGRAERAANVADAFLLTAKQKPPEAVLLVDDVFTTGATMQSAARALKVAGVKFVWGVALVRG